MDAVIIAAGEGTRMRPLTVGRPKPLLPIGEKSLIERLMDQCVDHVDQFIIVVGYKPDPIRNRIGRVYQEIPVTYTTQEKQLGTAHAVQQAQSHVTDPFIVLNGDVFVEKSLIERLAEATPPILTTTTVENPESYGVVEAEGDAVTGLYEKPPDPPTDQINVGLYSFTPAVFDAIKQINRSSRGEYEITDAIKRLIKTNHQVRTLEYTGQWIDVGRPWELLAAMEHHLDSLATNIDGNIDSDANITGPVSVAQGARIRSGTHLEGPVVIGEDADIGPNAYVRGPAVIESGASVGHAVEIKHSILMSNTNVNHLSYVGDSILGSRTNFGAGTVVANLRHDEQPVTMQIKGEKTPTGRRKLGVVTGPDTKTGINTSLCPGIKLPAESRTKPGETVFEESD